MPAARPQTCRSARRRQQLAGRPLSDLDGPKPPRVCFDATDHHAARQRGPPASSPEHYRPLRPEPLCHPLLRASHYPPARPPSPRPCPPPRFRTPDTAGWSARPWAGIASRNRGTPTASGTNAACTSGIPGAARSEPAARPARPPGKSAPTPPDGRGRRHHCCRCRPQKVYARPPPISPASQPDQNAPRRSPGRRRHETSPSPSDRR